MNGVRNRSEITLESGSSTIAVLVGFATLGVMIYLNSEYIKSDLEVGKKVQDRQSLLGVYRTLEDGIDCAATMEGVSPLNCSTINSLNDGLGPEAKTSKKLALTNKTASGFQLGSKLIKLECSGPQAGTGRFGLRIKVWDGMSGFVEKQGGKLHCGFIENSILNAGGSTGGSGGGGQPNCPGANEVYSTELARCIGLVAPDNYDQLFVSSQQLQQAKDQYQKALISGQMGGKGGVTGGEQVSPSAGE